MPLKTVVERVKKTRGKRIILNLKEDSPNAILAVRAAESLLRDGYDDCVYGYGEDHFWVRRNKSSISVFESGYYE